MRVLVCGSRNAPPAKMAMLNQWLDVLHYTAPGAQDIGVIISGTCAGPDKWGERWAEYADGNVRIERYPADWKKHGKAAGFMRNSTMVDACDIVVAVWDGTSKGTQDTIRKARLAKKPTVILYF